MSGRPFVAAVTLAVGMRNDCWDHYFYWDGGIARAERRNTYLESRSSALGPEWNEWVRGNIRHRINQDTGEPIAAQISREIERDLWMEGRS